MFQKIGYTIMQEGRYIPGYASSLVNKLGHNMESEISEAVRKLGSDRIPLRSLTLPDLLRMTSPAIAPDSDEHKQFILLVSKILGRAGYETPDIPLVAYNDTPVLTARDAVSCMLTERIPWIQKAEIGGDYATTNALKTFLPVIIKHIAEVERLRLDYYSLLRAKLADIGYKIFQKQPITQAEKTMFINYSNVEEGAPGEVLGFVTPNKAGEPITVQQTANPLVIEAYDLLVRNTITGPGLQFYRMLSNKNMASLIYYLGPHVTSLPLTSGYAVAMGPFINLELQVVEDRKWSESDQLTGIRDRFGDLPIVAKATEGMEPKKPQGYGSVQVQEIEWILNAPIVVCGPDGGKCPIYIDIPEVTLELRGEENISKYNWQYWSPWRQVVRTNLTGATPDELMMDKALETETAGQGLVDMLTIDKLKLVDLDVTAEARKVVRSSDRIFERIFFVRSGNKLESEEVDVTVLYSRGGTVMYRPAFSEFVIPPRHWYWTEDTLASDCISAQLGLNRESQLRNKFALTVSHNAAAIERLTTTKHPFDVEALIRLILKAK